MSENTFSHSKYNVCWISMLVIFVGTIVYPIFFEHLKSGEVAAPVVQKTPQTISYSNPSEIKMISVPAQQPAQESPVSVTSKVLFTRDLNIGDVGPDVKKLQEYLNNNGFIVATSGNGSPGHETERFGPGTAAALKKFQETYAEILLKPFGLTQGTGFFGKATRDFINS